MLKKNPGKYLFLCRERLIVRRCGRLGEKDTLLLSKIHRVTWVVHGRLVGDLQWWGHLTKSRKKFREVTSPHNSTSNKFVCPYIIYTMIVYYILYTISYTMYSTVMCIFHMQLVTAFKFALQLKIMQSQPLSVHHLCPEQPAPANAYPI